MDQTHPTLSPTIQVGIDAGQVRGADNRAIQLAVDALPATGGTVEVLPGTYTCYDAVHLRSHVRLVGHGDKTLLIKCDGARSALKIDADYAQLKITPQDTAGFRPGMGLLIADNQTGGWTGTATTILDVSEGVIRIADYLAMDYAARRDGWITNACSLVSAIDAEEVRIEGLTLDGNKATNWQMNGCRGGAIYLHKARRCRVDDCTVRDYHGDGISLQTTQDVIVQGCRVTGCTNCAMHPGTGSARLVIRDCTFSDNDQGGYFLCWRVQESTFERLVCERNGLYGISVGHKDTDNTFSDCTIRDNGRYGIIFRDEELYNGGHRNIWRACLIADNGDGEAGYGVRVRGHTHDNVFESCTFRDTAAGGVARQRVGLWLEQNARRFRTVRCTWTGMGENVIDDSGPLGDHQLDAPQRISARDA
ncbi:MAG: right-handed parallel beta-helix repeat-containing protein [Anaerolineae bacterium]|nr:right-handed parallel beta-helix repeat-containing protein [Anaerolineae bacterium]